MILTEKQQHHNMKLVFLFATLFCVSVEGKNISKHMQQSMFPIRNKLAYGLLFGKSVFNAFLIEQPTGKPQKLTLHI
jgi:hypothetical protein